MNRAQKETQVAGLKDKFAKASLAILNQFEGLKANDFNKLRRTLRKEKSEIHVVKNRLAKLALKSTPFEGLVSSFKGTTTLTLAERDPVTPAKVLTKFSKDFEVFKFKTALLNGKVLSEGDIKKLSELPSREQLVANMLGSMLAPARNWVTVLAQIPRQVVNVLAAVRDQKEKQGS